VSRLIARRLLLSIPLVFIVSALTFVLESFTPGDAARLILGTQFDPARYAQLREQLGINQPLYLQYWHWLDGLLHGSLGQSAYDGTPVAPTLNSRLGVTLFLVLGTVLVSALVGVTLGIVSALRGGMLGRSVDVLSLTGLALPSFWLGLVLIAVFAVAIRAFPATGYVPLLDSPADWARSLVLPVITLSSAAVAVIAKQTRDAMIDVLEREFIRALRARGVPERTIVFRHALRSAAIPVVAVLGLLFVGLLSGSVLVESVFALPGLGSLAVQATTEHDFPVISGVALYFTLVVVVVNLLVDLAYGWLNPKVRTQ
jgi:peptide/nickel transport system permease protein